VALATLTAALALAACDDGGGGGGATATTAPTPSGSPKVTSDTCVPLEHAGKTLGFTVPAGFSVESPPAVAAELAQTYKVNLLSLASLGESGGKVPTVAVAVFGFGKDDPEVGDALGASMRRFTNLVGGTNRTAVTATPTTVAGVPGSAGSSQDNRALDYSASDDVPTPVHFWTVPTTDHGVFVVAMAAKTAALDGEYRPKVEGGLKVGGC
jgi:hypothetical protein